MSSIKDIIDLLTKLRDTAKDREFASKISPIYQAMLQHQSEHFELREKNLILISENLELKNKISLCEQERIKLMGENTELIKENTKLKKEVTDLKKAQEDEHDNFPNGDIEPV